MNREADASLCTAKHLNHVAIVVSDIDASLRLYCELFGLQSTEVENVADQGVRATLVQVGGSHLELIQPTGPDSGVARFIERRGEGLHHICLEVQDLRQTLDRLAAAGVELVDHSPREGLAGMIAFLHPRAAGGVLVELVDEATTRR